MRIAMRMIIVARRHGRGGALELVLACGDSWYWWWQWAAVVAMDNGGEVNHSSGSCDRGSNGACGSDSGGSAASGGGSGSSSCKFQWWQY